mmetsp:Transcript_7946/g.11789  ORF Transcript_7946/g.11789 Transcript_7946/m.11789 type:complete len:399 (+) Transcript_7946:31-1227(+)
MVGSADVVAENASKEIIFAEDLVDDENDIGMTDYPSGLVNLMNSCYISAGIQALRTVKPLKEALKKYKGSTMSSNRDEKLTASLRDLFKQFETSNGHPITPAQFVQSVRSSFPEFATTDQTPVGNVYQQQDADEFMAKLKQSLNNELRKVDNSVADVFQGTYNVTLQNNEVEGEVKETKEQFYALKCFIKKEIRHLEQGIDHGLKGTMERHSEKLGRNAIWSKQSKIAALPEYLMVNFVRFEWKENDKSYCKILKPVRYNMQLDIADLCTDELKGRIQQYRKEQLDAENKRIEARRKAMSTDKMVDDVVDESADKMDTSEDRDNETGMYELVGIVSHKGRSVNSGHYVGWTKQENGVWMMFDDDNVRESTEKEIKDLCGGGDNHIALVSIYRKIPPKD